MNLKVRFLSTFERTNLNKKQTTQTLKPNTQNNDYKNWLVELKQKIRNSQLSASLAVNAELIMLYWDLGKQIVEKQEEAKWGSGFLEDLSKDLKKEFPSIKGFSPTNLRYCKQFYSFYNDFLIHQEPVDELVLPNKLDIKLWKSLICKIPWSQNILIVQKAKTQKEAKFYINKTIENNWSRASLLNQIDSDLFQRQRNSISNFTTALPQIQSDLATELLKDPYQFDFLQITEKHNELELENALTSQITNFLLELGAGFSFVGKQYNLKLEDKDYYLDLLFYHLKLRCFVVIELKVGAFKPEYAGKLNFYLNLMDDTLKHENDMPSIGIIICKTKNNVEAEYALRGIEKPIGISEYELNKILPESLKGILPSIEEIEIQLKNKDL